MKAAVKELKRELNRRARTFTGEDAADFLLDYVGKAPEGDPVREIVTAQLHSKPKEVKDMLNELLRNRPELWAVPYATITDEGRVIIDYVPAVPAPDPQKQKLAVSKLRYLLERDLFGNLRLCANPTCQRPFFGKFKHSRFHDDQCKLAAEATNEDYRTRRREYMRQRGKEKA